MKKIIFLSLLFLVSCTQAGEDYNNGYLNTQNEAYQEYEEDIFAPSTFLIPEELFFVGASKDSMIEFFVSDFSGDVEIENSYINLTLSLENHLVLLAGLNTDIDTFFSNVLNIDEHVLDYEIERSETYSKFILSAENRNFLETQPGEDLIDFVFPQLSVMEYLYRILMGYDVYLIQDINFYVIDESEEETFLLYDFFENAPQSLRDRRY